MRCHNSKPASTTCPKQKSVRLFSIRLLSILFYAITFLNTGVSTDAVASSANSSVQTASDQTQQALNINTASAARLAHSLPGVGPVKARAIVLYRESNGPFKTVDEPLKVKGIGPVILAKVRKFVTISPNIKKRDSVSTLRPLTQIQQQSAAVNAVTAVVDLARRAAGRPTIRREQSPETSAKH